MPVDKDYLFEGLLGHNYFPMVKEKRDDIPPLFSSEGLTTEIGEKLIAQQTSLVDPCAPKPHSRAYSGYDQIEYRTTRFNNASRLMHIPCPGPFARLCGCLRDNWHEINWICSNDASQIKPEVHADKRVLRATEVSGEVDQRVVVKGHDNFPTDAERHLDMSFGAKYFVEADVSSCFPSLYTHAIPWALVGHKHAKDHKGPFHWHNQVDWCQRHLKRNETHGVPVGPATSNIINEVILGKVDEVLTTAGYKFVRYIDDYKCYCPSRDMADEFLRDLEKELGKYLLLLNSKKVTIEELPLATKSEWVTEMAARLPSGDIATSREVIACMDGAMGLQNRFPAGSVIKYAARAVANKLSAESAGIFAKYLLQVAADAPIVLPVLADVVRRHRQVLQTSHLDAILERQLFFRRSDSACWTLYMYGLCGAVVSDGLADEIIKSKDCMAMAALLAIKQHKDKVVDFVKSLSTAIPYDADQHWLLIHELQVDMSEDWCHTYAEQSGLKLLADEGVSFLRTATMDELAEEVEPEMEASEEDGLP
ncbi:MAG: RNA-directed DNA polymerase [Phycisphaeraceae bacterium]|nr:RNA-directed DNA polymerase [Phycisphaeraceae bacterium]QYK48965.1 MAG: RNA-directed DNA polymerase [Phycisphaeraceae bacterium]